MSCSSGVKSSLNYCGRNGTEARPSFLQASTCLTLFYILNIEYPKPVAAIIALSVLALLCLFVCEFIFI